MTTDIPTLRWPLDARPVIRNAGHFPLSDPAFRHAYRATTHALHLHEYHGMIDMDGRRLALSPGTVTISPARGVTRYALRAPGRHWCVHFTPAAMKKPTLELPLRLVLGEGQSYVAQRMAHIARLWAMTGDAIAQTSASLALQELLLHLSHRQRHDVMRPGVNQADQAVDRVLELIHERIDQPLRVAELARQVNLSQNYLARNFRGRMGMAIPRYLLRVRMERAKLLLGTTDLPVKQIAVQVGLPDAQHFNKQFRRMVGRCPSAMRGPQ
ncbi:MAG: AraC family transcriptional regulator [Phycisphaeraceae bacterium]